MYAYIKTACVCTCSCHDQCGEIREEFVNVGFILLSLREETQGSDAGCRAWLRAPLPSESSCWTHIPVLSP